MKRTILLLLLLPGVLLGAGNTPLQNAKITGTSQVSGTLTFNSGATLDVSSGTFTLANNQIPWAKVNKTGSSLADLATRNFTQLSDAPASYTGQALKVLRVKADETGLELATASTGSGTGDMLAANNLSDLTNPSTALTNLGGTTVGKNLFTLTNPSAVRFLQINADNSITPQSAATHLAAIGGIDGSALNASNLSSGTVPDGRFPATLPAASGANLTNLNGSNIASGTVSISRLPTGTGASNVPIGGVISAGSVGDATHIPVLTYNAAGQITGVTTATPSGTTGATAFTGLSDVPSSYTGASLKKVRVNSGGTGLEFVNDFSTFGASGAGHSTGLVPDPGSSAGTTKFLREDGTFQVPPGSTYSTFGASGASHSSGLVPDPGATAGTTKFLREDGTFQVPSGSTGSSTFTSLSDAPASYTGQAGKYVQVNSGATGLQFTSGGSSYPTPNDPPVSANAKDDEFNGTSLDAKWTWINQGTATASVGGGSLSLAFPATTTTNLRMIYQAASSTPWTLTARISTHTLFANVVSDGIGVSDSTTGKIIIFGIRYNNGMKLVITKYNSTTTGVSSPYDASNNTSIPQQLYLRIADDSTNLKFSYSIDGLNFTQLYSEGRTVFLTPDRIFIGGENTLNQPVLLGCDWFRVTSP